MLNSNSSDNHSVHIAPSFDHLQLVSAPMRPAFLGTVFLFDCFHLNEFMDRLKRHHFQRCGTEMVQSLECRTNHH